MTLRVCDEAIQKIVAYRNDIYSTPAISHSRMALRERAYIVWIIDEILLLVLDHPLMDPRDVIELFGIKISAFMYSTNNSQATFIFKTAENTIEDILDIIS